MNRVLFPLLLFCAGTLLAQNRAPAWYLDKEAAYPSGFYIAAVGEGSSRAEAETKAVAGISLFFNTSTEVRNQAIREFNEAVSGGGTDFSKKTYISEDAVVRSEEEFLGVRFADPWNDQARGNWAVLAYIDRQEAAGIYGAKIAANMAALRSLADDGAREREPLYTCGLLNKAALIGDLTEEYIKTASVVDSRASAKYAADLAKINEVRSAYRAKRTGLTFGVSVTSPENSGRVGRKIQQLLESRGYTVTARNPRYTVSAVLSAEESTSAAGFVVRPGLVVGIEGAGEAGEALFSYGKNYGRFASMGSTAGAYNRALLAIEKDLEENFITQFSAMIGK
jgi:hypothetical protein